MGTFAIVAMGATAFYTELDHHDFGCIVSDYGLHYSYDSVKLVGTLIF